MTPGATPARTLRIDGPGMAELVSGLLSTGASVQLEARGGSMSPWIRDGDVVTIAPIAAPPREALRRGDVVAFCHPGSDGLVIHRLLLRTADGWITRGDRCSAADGAVPNANLLGPVTGATRRGRRVRLRQGLLGLVLARASRAALVARDRFRRHWAAGSPPDARAGH